MFIHLSVSHSVHGGGGLPNPPWMQTPPGLGRPPGCRLPPRVEQTPLDADPPGLADPPGCRPSKLGRSPPGCRSPWVGQNPQGWADPPGYRPPPPDTVNKWAVRILLECILVCSYGYLHQNFQHLAKPADTDVSWRFLLIKKNVT